MAEENEKQDQPEKKKRKSLLGALFSPPEPDEDYVPDLKSQWERMGTKGRVKFIVGVLIGLVLFFGALIGVYLLIGAIIG